MRQIAMHRRLGRRLLEVWLLALGLLALLGLVPANARPPRNSARLPQEFEVHVPMPPRRGYGGPGRIPIYRNPDARAWVSSIFTRVASAANLVVLPQLSDEEQRERDRREEAGIPDADPDGRLRRRKGSSISILEWEIVNAFATPGEKLYVTTALLEFVESDDELAGVIAHEIAHVRCNHIEKRLKRQMVSSLLFALATVRGGSDAFLAGQAMASIPVMPYGQKQELESDAVGIEYLTKAGYDPNGMPSFLEKLAATDKEEAKQGSGGFASIFNTHPPTPKRIELARKKLESLGVVPGKPSHLSYDFKLERLSIDLSSLDLSKLSGRPTTGVPPETGVVFTSMRILGNLVPHGDFEGSPRRAVLPDGWRVLQGVAALDRDEPQEGSHSLRVSGGSAGGTAEVESPAIPVEADQDYLLSGQLRAGDPHERLSLGLRYFDENMKLLRTDYPAARKVFVPQEWTRYQGVVFASGNTFSLPPGARWVRVVVAATYTKRASSWFDDLMLVRVRK